MPYATLVKGVDYQVHGHTFRKGVQHEISSETFKYLKENPAFELDAKEDTPAKSDKYTTAALKKLNAEQQKQVISEFGADPDKSKNEEERISLILELQEKE